MTTRQNTSTAIAVLDIDTSAVTAAVHRFADYMREAVERLAAAFKRFGPVVREVANDPVNVAGIESTYLVRAGLDPSYRDPAARDDLVWSILTGEAEDTALLTPENRARVAAAALRGWVSSYDAHPVSVPMLAWHRLVGSTAVEVSRG